MKFKVRDGFIVHNSKIVTVKQAGKDVKQEQLTTYYEGQDVDFDKAEALAHIHKLEPIDKEAKALVDSLVLIPAEASNQLDHGSAISALTEQISALTALVSSLVVGNTPAEAKTDGKSTG